MWIRRNSAMKNVTRDQYTKVYKGRGYKPVVKTRKAKPVAKRSVDAEFTTATSSDETPRTKKNPQMESQHHVANP